ncbi:cytochrome P450 family protein [Nocardia puris]|uniref:cytochrome P450 n=1 Tax=Nocardia puris TaxID=208602 RepID=UPI002E20143E
MKPSDLDAAYVARPVLARPQPRHPTPVEKLGPRIRLQDPSFAQDPHTYYAAMRRDYGSLVPIELADGVEATLVIAHSTAVRILNDPVHFPADPRIWQASIAPTCPILAMVEYRRNALRSAGAAHERYRGATNYALAAIDLHSIRPLVARHATLLINHFSPRGRADLLTDYFLPLVFSTLNALLGCPDDIGGRVAAASAAMFEAVDTGTVNETLETALGSLIDLKAARPASDVVTRLLDGPAALDREEITQALVTFYAAGIEPQLNLAANALRTMVTDDTYSGEHGLAQTVMHAVEATLGADPPLANYCLSYPLQPQLVDNIWLPAHQPVVISMAAASTDPAITGGASRSSAGGWHLGFSTGPHGCPEIARRMGMLIAEAGIENLLAAIPDLRLAVHPDELSWRPGPFHRALAAFPVVFDPAHPMPIPSGSF